MGYVKEPEGVDFIIQSKPLTDKDREQISKFIQAYKQQMNRTKKGKTSTNTRRRNTGRGNA